MRRRRRLMLLSSGMDMKELSHQISDSLFTLNLYSKKQRRKPSPALFLCKEGNRLCRWHGGAINGIIITNCNGESYHSFGFCKKKSDLFFLYLGTSVYILSILQSWNEKEKERLSAYTRDRRPWDTLWAKAYYTRTCIILDYYLYQRSMTAIGKAVFSPASKYITVSMVGKK